MFYTKDVHVLQKRCTCFQQRIGMRLWEHKDKIKSGSRHLKIRPTLFISLMTLRR